MSVTFSLCKPDGLSACNTDHFGTPCTDPYHLEERGTTGFCDCIFEAMDACEICGTSVNVSNRNATLVLDRLGIGPSLDNIIDPDDLLGRALTSNVGRDDTGQPDIIDGNFIDCGLRQGYFESRFESLAHLATVAKAHDAIITFG